ncbi:hypothetical protein CU097_011203 [Rhizopus azygosporus]|uniref:Uncharacterized protein n=1 Tax=Rhizopus azygosporus TaxID=86630 RepID=A0A367JFB1_RHIAZ|nr:hypothetical protein CU097_011203 [Rhizopus azygosporus]
MLSKNNYEVQDVVRCNITNIMNTNGTSGEKMKKIDALKPINGEQRAQKEIFQYTLNQRVNKPSLFTNSNIKQYPEKDFKLKSWAIVLEELSGCSSVAFSRC